MYFSHQLKLLHDQVTLFVYLVTLFMVAVMPGTLLTRPGTGAYFPHNCPTANLSWYHRNNQPKLALHLLNWLSGHNFPTWFVAGFPFSQLQSLSRRVNTFCCHSTSQRCTHCNQLHTATDAASRTMIQWCFINYALKKRSLAPRTYLENKIFFVF